MATASSLSKNLRGPFSKARSTIVIFLFCYFLLGKEVDGSTNEKHVYTGEVPVEDAQRISILIGKSGEGEEENEQKERLVGISQDEGGGGGDSGNSTDGVAASESTTWQKCGLGSKCCYQYTWPSDRETIPSPGNATCEYLKKKNKADDMACFDPLVFTRAGDTQLGTPPDFTELVDNAKRNNWNIFCPMTGGKNCVTYTYYSRDGSNAMTNQTKFCGIVTNKNSGAQINSGCHREEVDGYTREVCVCSSKTLCNGQSAIISRSHVGLLTILIITAATQFSIVNKLLS
ncbi:hypothetical protein Ocin01_03556 [Orchesella cincta]|uniref:Uncharacterized protein n=1 Tax=Orchesella cincta TaxID=48709 RepID=A0A1D2NCY8_ORCCI|nr:hypothetical protein Ocin01_03556 [Orchesella cincta]